jgi:hypothetical protein
MLELFCWFRGVLQYALWMPSILQEVRYEDGHRWKVQEVLLLLHRHENDCPMTSSM